MLHNEARKLLVEGYEATHNAEAIAKIFHVNKYTVYHLEERKRKTGSVDLQTWRPCIPQQLFQPSAGFEA